MKLKSILSFLIVLSAITNSYSQKFTFPKLNSDVKKEAKRYQKETWQPFIGGMPISQQLNNSFNKQNEIDDFGIPKWIITNGTSLAQTLAAAEMQANEIAKINLVGLMESNIKAVIETELANNQLTKSDAASITKSVSVATNKLAQKLGRTIQLVKVYRIVGENYEVQVQIAYNFNIAKQLMVNQLKTELGSDVEKLKIKFDSFLNPNDKN
jgi:hypothetical protein